MSPAEKKPAKKAASKSVKKAVANDIDLYDFIRAPMITEKATMASEHNQFVFRVPIDASKPEIKQAVETLFKVQVKAVNTLITKGKLKRFRGRPGRRADVKKAIVTLAAGQSIDVTTGL
jgi:large subunit ribosomal protein L23